MRMMDWDSASQVALRTCSREGGLRSLCILAERGFGEGGFVQ